MTDQDTVPACGRHRRLALNKVPGVTVHFWGVKLLCTTVGETAADFLNINLNLGLAVTSLVSGLLLAGAFTVELRADRYHAGRYWLTVALMSVFGTLVTDNLTDRLRVPLEASTIGLGVLLGLVFVLWYRLERTLSLRAVVTRRRESFYWLAVLVAFALGTAAGDLMAEVLGLGYAVTGVVAAAVIVAIALAWRFGLHPVPAFWIVYVLTRPLGASLGNYLAQPASRGGLGFGAALTSVVFLIAILWIVTYLAVTRVDVTVGAPPPRSAGGGLHTAVVLALLLFCAATGYTWRTLQLRDDSAAIPPATSVTSAASGSLGDLSRFRVITQDTLDLLNAGSQTEATSRVGDLETAWDDAEARLRPRNAPAWISLDDKVDAVLRRLRATRPQPDRERQALTDLLTSLH